ncbi:MAG: THUMP-like domain-containing protein [Spirosomataceae bacterium]
MSKILKIELYKQLIEQHKEVDIQTFILKNPLKLNSDDLRFVIEQINARQKAKNKNPTWCKNPEILFPPALSVEQSSSEITANYKASLVSGKTLIDLTGGMGIDTFAFAHQFETVIYAEQKDELVEATKYNFEKLGIENVDFLNEDSVEYLAKTNKSFDWIYIDPARRDQTQKKVFKIEDCEPNLLKIKDLLLNKSNNILVKYSPLLDIKLAIEHLQNISEVHVIALENEVKELLFVINKGYLDIPKIKTVNLTSKKNQFFEFDFETEQKTNINYAKPQQFIYEPNASILKAGAFKSVSKVYNIAKLAPSSHLYTSNELVQDFTGRTFKCEDVCKFDKKEILSYLPDNQGNISTRNFPMKPEEIKKKLGIKDGGDTYLFFTEDFEKKKIVLICKKVQ